LLAKLDHAYAVAEAAKNGSAMAEMPIEAHKSNGRSEYAHLAAFSRLLCGIAPWLELGGTAPMRETNEHGLPRSHALRLMPPRIPDRRTL
jgi:hypothetical protein